MQPPIQRRHKEHRSSVNRTTDFPHGVLKSSLNIDRKEPITRIQHYYEQQIQLHNQKGGGSSKRTIVNETPNGIPKLQMKDIALKS